MFPLKKTQIQKNHNYDMISIRFQYYWKTFFLLGSRLRLDGRGLWVTTLLGYSVLFFMPSSKLQKTQVQMADRMLNSKKGHIFCHLNQISLRQLTVKMPSWFSDDLLVNMISSMESQEITPSRLLEEALDHYLITCIIWLHAQRTLTSILKPIQG